MQRSLQRLFEILTVNFS